MTTEYYINFLRKQLNSLTDKTALLIEFYDDLGWKITRRIYRSGNKFTIEFIKSNGKTFHVTGNEDQTMNFMIVNNVVNASIIEK